MTATNNERQPIHITPTRAAISKQTQPKHTIYIRQHERRSESRHNRYTYANTSGDLKADTPHTHTPTRAAIGKQTQPITHANTGGGPKADTTDTYKMNGGLK